MGQRAIRRSGASAAANSSPVVSIFPTEFGWCGIAGQNGRTTDIFIGHFDASGVRQQFAQRLAERGGSLDFDESDWNPALRCRLEQYGAGRPVAFDDIELDMPGHTPFQDRVIQATRRIPFGKTISYAELARRAGSAGAARAVGTVMSTNRFPIVIPCHRVVGSGGKLGGYSAPTGLDLKARLLAMEAETACGVGD